MQQIPVCSSPADEGSLMSKEYIFEDFEDDYDTNPWEDVQKKWAADSVLRHCLQYKENVFVNSETGQKRGKYAPFWPVFAYIPIFIAWESDIFGKNSKISRMKNTKTSKH